MKVLVTGAAGRVGQFVVKELAEQGHTIRALDRRPLSKEAQGQVAETLYLDTADPLAMLGAMEGCAAVIHLAAYPQPYNVTHAELLRINVIGTQNVLDAAVAHGIGRVILTSSIGALGFSFPTHPCLPDYLPIDTAHPRRPQDIYGLSKVMNEESAASATRLSGMTTIVLRPPAVWDLERAKARGWLKNVAERVPDRLDNDFWAYVDGHDLAVAYRLALTAPLEGHHVFFTMADDVSSGWSPRQLVETHLPQLVGDLDKLTGNSLYDLAPAKALLGFAPTRTWRQVWEG